MLMGDDGDTRQLTPQKNLKGETLNEQTQVRTIHSFFVDMIMNEIPSEACRYERGLARCTATTLQCGKW